LGDCLQGPNTPTEPEQEASSQETHNAHPQRNNHARLQERDLLVMS
jgi:hypothetical protein